MLKKAAEEAVEVLPGKPGRKALSNKNLVKKKKK